MKEFDFSSIYYSCPLNITNYAFRLFLKSILDFAVNIAFYDIDLIEKDIILTKKDDKVIAYIIRHYKNGRKTKTPTEEEIDIELCPDEVQNALNKGYDVKVNIKKSFNNHK